MVPRKLQSKSAALVNGGNSSSRVHESRDSATKLSIELTEDEWIAIATSPTFKDNLSLLENRLVRLNATTLMEIKRFCFAQSALAKIA